MPNIPPLSLNHNSLTPLAGLPMAVIMDSCLEGGLKAGSVTYFRDRCALVEFSGGAISYLNIARVVLPRCILPALQDRQVGFIYPGIVMLLGGRDPKLVVSPYRH